MLLSLATLLLLQPLRGRLASNLGSILNQNKRVAEYLSIFIHDKLKRNGDELSEQVVDTVLERVVSLLDFVQEIDLFERHYQQHLAQRLLSNEAIVENTENQMLLRLKVRCSSTFMRQLEGMFMDMTNSSKFTRQNVPNSTGIDLSVRVLTTVHWPIHRLKHSCLLPRIVNEAYECFQSYYSTVHPKRRLILQSNLGKSTLVVTCSGCTENGFIRDESSSVTTSNFVQRKNYRLEVSTHQMIVLMLFNKKDSYSFEVRSTIRIDRLLREIPIATQINRTRDISRDCFGFYILGDSRANEYP